MSNCQVVYAPPDQPAPEPTRFTAPQISAIKEVIDASHSKLLACYLEALEVWPQLEGSAVINFTVNPKGSVEDTAVAMHHSTVFDASVGCCIARVAQTWQFPAPPDSKSFAVEYPFDLIKDMLRFSAAHTSRHPFTAQFEPTLIIAPPQPANGGGLHNVY